MILNITALRFWTLYMEKFNDEYFSIRCGDIGQNGVGGHAHYDQLSIECFSNTNGLREILEQEHILMILIKEINLDHLNIIGDQM